MHAKKPDRPDWWGPRWNPDTCTFEDSSNTGYDAPFYYPPKEVKKTEDRPKRSKVRPFDTVSNEPVPNKDMVQILDQLLNKIDSQKENLTVLESRLIEETLRLETVSRENFQLKTEIGKLRQIIRDLSQTDTKPSRPSSLKYKSIPEMYIDESAPKEVFDAVYRALANKYHPDKGGDEEKQKTLNLIKEDVYKKKGWS